MRMIAQRERKQVGGVFATAENAFRGIEEVDFLRDCVVECQAADGSDLIYAVDVDFGRLELRLGLGLIERAQVLDDSLARLLSLWVPDALDEVLVLPSADGLGADERHSAYVGTRMA